MTRILVIPDAHAHPDYDNDRFDILGKFAKKMKPDAVACLGDWADMVSLCRYEKKTLSAEGRRVEKDVKACREAQARFFEAWGTGADKAFKLMCRGNHDERILKAVSEDPHLFGSLTMEHLGFEEHGWNVVPFKEVGAIDGWHFSHYFAAGVMGLPIGGENPAASILKKTMVSSVSGHSHLLDMAVRTDAAGNRVTAIVAGNYGHLDYKEGWCLNTRHLWWNGVTIIDTKGEKGDWTKIQFVSQQEMGEMV